LVVIRKVLVLERIGQRAVALECGLLDGAVVAWVLRQHMGHELIALYVAEAEQLLAELASAVALLVVRRKGLLILH
jgi:hypothetical protein